MTVTDNKAEISVVGFENASVATGYWLSTPHYYGYNYAVARVMQDGQVVQDYAAHVIYAARL